MLNFISLLLFATLSFAQSNPEGETKASTPTQVLLEENSAITDERLRAEGGARARYSLKFNLNYAGPPVTDLGAKDQPNPDGSFGGFQTALSGTFGGQYRISKRSTFGLSAGFKFVRPFQGTDRRDVNNPIVSYSFADRWRGVQLRTAPSVIIRTVPDFLKVGQYAYLLLMQSALYDVPESRFSFGADLSLAYFLYDRGYQSTDGRTPQYSIELNPLVKMRFNDQFSIMTSLNLPALQLRSAEPFSPTVRAVTQKIGVSYAYTRDIYINPFLTIYPGYLSLDTTAINVSSVFSVF